MNAYEIPGLRFSMPAGKVVPRYCFVSVDSDGTAVPADSTRHVIGASMNEVTSKEIDAGNAVLEIADGIVMVKASVNVTPGAAVYSDGDGFVATEGTIKVGIAITGATIGQLVAVKL